MEIYSKTTLYQALSHVHVHRLGLIHLLPSSYQNLNFSIHIGLGALFFHIEDTIADLLK